ncbi:hypothetical protein AWENTII_008976 [Aspergillus wentii]
MAAPTVAIAGASGNLGKKLTRAFFLPAFKSRFQDIILLSRTESPKLQEFTAQGAKIRIYNKDSLAETLSGVDVLINAIGPEGHAFKETLLRGLPATSVKLYIPSEFGVDHYVHDFPHVEWDAKKHHMDLASKLLGQSDTKICKVFAGLFLEDSIGPWFGFNTAKGHYEAVGDSSRRISFTSMEDVGRAVATLVSSSIDAVPEQIHLSGDSKSVEEIAQIMQENGSGSIKVSCIDLEEYKSKILARPSGTPERYLRFLMGEGKIDHTQDGIGNGNDIVNANETNWKWKSMQDLAHETGGRPWADFKWEPTV